ncbi:unnamed protein product, partial [Polarella glacialis]
GLRTQLFRAEGQLRRLSPHAVFQLRSYLERHFRDHASAMQVQEAIVRLVQCFFLIGRVEVPSLTHDGLLSGVRKLFRDPHSFTSKLCNMSPVSSDEAKRLAPLLTSSTQFRRVREKEVNDCYEALQGWLEAFYNYSSVSEQVGPAAQQLDRQEWLLRRLSGQEMSLRPAAAGQVVLEAAATTSSCAAPSSASRNANPAAVAPRSSPSVTARVTASPLSRSRQALGGGVQGASVSSLPSARPAVLAGRARPATGSPGAAASATGTAAPDSGDGRGGQQHSRSPSPATAQRGRLGGGISARPRGVPSVAFGGSSNNMGTQVSARSVLSSPLGRNTTREVAVARPGSSLTAPPASASAASNREGADGLNRVQSEKSLARSPRPGARRESRSPSPG